MADVGFARGLQSQYDAKLNNSQISNDAIYYITDTHRIYLGTNLVGIGEATAEQVFLVPQTPGATIEDGTNLMIVDKSFADLYNTFANAYVSWFFLELSSYNVLAFQVGNVDAINNSIYLYAIKDKKLYDITLEPSGNDMVGTLGINDIIYPDGDEVSY